MTKKHFIRAADMVRAILAGEWTNEPPAWADQKVYYYAGIGDGLEDYKARAVQTAEAFIVLFSAENPRFDVQRFLIACGLVAKPFPINPNPTPKQKADMKRRLLKGLRS